MMKCTNGVPGSKLSGIIQRVFRDERGVSLVELLVGIAIALGIAAFIGTAVWQFFTVTRWGNNQMLAASDHQTAILWLGRDIAEAQTFEDGNGAVYATFKWPGGNPQFRYRYDSTEGIVIREQLDESGAVQTSNVVARYVANQADVEFKLDDTDQEEDPILQIIIVEITTTSGDQTFNSRTELAMRVP
ncbi:MAG: type II secretion system protein J [Anaerolineales bacterium]